MSDVRSALVRAHHHRRGVRARLAALEQEVQEQRQLNRRVAELTDVVAELLVPLARNEPAVVDEIVERYRLSI
ncbi:MAG TPA: DUF6752 domain-containing protein [Nocardioidaceae bacterium]|nr:DUF6752 domain-containing protein [Nocardioidaceae bacterium]